MGKMGGQGDMVYLGQKGRRRISDDDKDAEDNVSPSGISTPNYLPLAISPFKLKTIRRHPQSRHPLS